MKLRALLIGLCVSGLIWGASQNVALAGDWLSALFGYKSTPGYSFSSGGFKTWSNPYSSGWSLTLPDSSKFWSSNYGNGWSFPTPSGRMWGSTYNNGTQLRGWSWKY
jgi:hypothetical protein